MLIFLFVYLFSKYTVELTETLVWLVEKKQLCSIFWKAALKLSFICFSSTFLISLLLPATQRNMIIEVFKVMTTTLRTSHFGKKNKHFSVCRQKSNRSFLGLWRPHTHTQGKSHMISENYLIEPQLASHISVTLREPMMAFLVLQPPHSFSARLLKQGSYRILNTMAKDMYLDVSVDMLVHHSFLCVLHRGTKRCFFRNSRTN